MRIVQVVAKQKLQLLEIDEPKLAEDEVLVEVAYCGICGSDLPRYFEGAVHSFPQVLGHEFTGKVIKRGNNVHNIDIGTLVTVAPLVPCFNCNQCLSGNPAMCKKYSFIGSRRQGAMATHVAVPKENIVKLPPSIDLKTASLIEPLTVAIHGINLLGLEFYEDVLILGSGTIGLMTLIAIKNRTKGSITVVDINDDKLKFAKELGADRTINSLNTNLEKYYEENEKATAIIETAGSNITQVQAISLSKEKTKILFMGTCTKEVKFEPDIFEKILRNELTLKGSWMSYSSPFPGNEWKTAIEIIEKQKDIINKLITHVYNLNNIDKAFEKVVDKNDKVGKVLISIGEENSDQSIKKNCKLR